MYLSHTFVAQSTWAVEYNDCISSEEEDLTTNLSPVYEIKQSYRELSEMLELL